MVTFLKASIASVAFSLLLHPQPQLTELTATDITTVKNFRADRATVFGVSLGMTMQQALQLLSAHKQLLVEQDADNPTRRYVYAPTPTAKGDAILYYIWEPNDSRLLRITVYQPFATYLRGHTKDLVTSAALDGTSTALKSFLGSPTRSQVTLNIPSINLKETTFYYDDRLLTVTDWNKESVRFALVLP
jgi:hypothetical protein